MKISTKKFFITLLLFLLQTNSEFTLLDSPKSLILQEKNNKYIELGNPTNYVQLSNAIITFNPLEASYFYNIFASTENVKIFLNHMLYPNATNTITEVKNSNYYKNQPGRPLVYNYTTKDTTIETEIVLSVTNDYESRIAEFYSRINDRKDPGIPIKYFTFFTGQDTNNSHGKNIGLFATSLDLKKSSLEKINGTFDEIILNVPQISNLNSQSSIKICNKTISLTTTGLQWLKFLTISYFQTPINGQYVISKHGLNTELQNAALSITTRNDFIAWNNIMEPGEYEIISTLYSKLQFPKTEEYQGKTLADVIKIDTKNLLNDAELKIPCVSTVQNNCADIYNQIKPGSELSNKILEHNSNATSIISAATSIEESLKTINELRTTLIENHTNLSTIKEQIHAINNFLSSIQNSLYGTKNNGEQATHMTVYQQLDAIRNILDGLNNGITNFYSKLPVMNTIIDNYTSIAETLGTLCYDDKSMLSITLNNIEDKTDSLKHAINSTQELINNTDTGGIIETMTKVSDACNSLTSVDSEIMTKLNEILNRIDPGYALYNDVLPAINKLLETFGINTLEGFSDTNPIMASVISTKLEVLLTKIENYKEENSAIDAQAIYDEIKNALNPILAEYNIAQLETSNLEIIKLRLQDLKTAVEQLKNSSTGDPTPQPLDYDSIKSPLNDILRVCALNTIGEDTLITPDVLKEKLNTIKVTVNTLKNNTINYDTIKENLDIILEKFSITPITDGDNQEISEAISSKLGEINTKYDSIINSIKQLPLKTYDTPEECKQILTNNPQLIYYVTAKILAVDSNIAFDDQFHELSVMTSTNNKNLNDSIFGYIRRNRFGVFYNAFKDNINTLIANTGSYESSPQQEILSRFFKTSTNILSIDNYEILSHEAITSLYDNIVNDTTKNSYIDKTWTTLNNIQDNLARRSWDNKGYSLQNAIDEGDTTLDKQYPKLQKHFDNLLQYSPYLLFYLWAKYVTAEIEETTVDTKWHDDTAYTWSEYWTMTRANTHIDDQNEANQWLRGRKHVLLNRLHVIKLAFNSHYFEDNNTINDINKNFFQKCLDNVNLSPDTKASDIRTFLKTDSIISLTTSEYWTQAYHKDL